MDRLAEDAQDLTCLLLKSRFQDLHAAAGSPPPASLEYYMIPTLSGIIAVGALLDIFTAYAYATPITRQSITALSAVQISAFKPYSHFASAGYCQPSATLSWSCGSTSLKHYLILIEFEHVEEY